MIFILLLSTTISSLQHKVVMTFLDNNIQEENLVGRLLFLYVKFLEASIEKIADLPPYHPLKADKPPNTDIDVFTFVTNFTLFFFIACYYYYHNTFHADPNRELTIYI